MDTRISELLPDYMPENPCEELKELSVRHLLTMTAGQQRPLLMGDSRKTLKETDWDFLCPVRPLLRSSGTRIYVQ